MSGIEVVPASPREPGASRLLLESHALMRRLFEVNHFLSLDQLEGPDIRFFAARDGTAILGTAALALKDGYGEVKSMYVDPAARGRGVAALLMTRLEAEALSLGLPLLRLETADLLEEACRLYERHGFVRRGAFGAYPDDGASVFMEKRLA